MKMKRNKIEDLFRKIKGLEYALENEFDRTVPFDVFDFVEFKTIDIKLLAEVLRKYVESESDQYSSYEHVRCYNESLYIVWKNKKIEKSDKIDYQLTLITIDDWTKEMTFRDQSEHWEIEPVASYFIDNDEIEHLILIQSESSNYTDERKKFTSVKVKFFCPSSKMNITETSKSIMKIWESEGPCGLDDHIFNID